MPFHQWMNRNKDEAGTHPDEDKEVVLLYLRIFLAVGWLRAASEKIIRSDWWSGADIKKFLTKQHDVALAFWRPVMDHVFFHRATALALIVVVLEISIGLAIALDIGTTLALRTAIVLNVIFVLCGVVNPSAFYLVMEMTYLSAVTDRAVGMKPMRYSRHILMEALAWFGVTILFIPFIRTIQPSEIIADPASMLSLIAFITGAALLYRWWRKHKAFKDIWRDHPDQGETT